MIILGSILTTFESSNIQKYINSYDNCSIHFMHYYAFIAISKLLECLLNLGPQNHNYLRTKNIEVNFSFNT